MANTYATAADLKLQFIEDVTLGSIEAGDDDPPIEPNGEWDLLATGLSNMASVLVSYVQGKEDAINPLEATGQDLDDWRRWLQLPEVGASPAAGPVTITVSGTGTIPAGQQFVAPNGLVASVISGAVDKTGPTTVDALMVAPGSAGNLEPGTQVRLTGGPPNLQVLATIPTRWVGGNEAEDDTRKRTRILSRLRSAGAGWGALRDRALESTGAISDAFVYWALGGPGSAKVVVVSNTSATTRQTSSAAVAAVDTYLANWYPKGTWAMVVQSAIDHPVDVEIKLGLPRAGAHRWLAGGPIARTTVTSAGEETAFTVANAATLGSLVPGETIACWDSVNLTVATAKVVTISGANITTTVWSSGGGPNVSAGRTWIFPACDGLQTIVAEWLKIMLTLGPGENLASTDPGYQFAARLPVNSANTPMGITSVQLYKLREKIPEAYDIDFVSTPTATPVPTLKSQAPYVARLHNFAVYPI